MKISVAPDGTCRFIYADELRPLLQEGAAKIARASHVEPTEDGRWTADMSPSGGPVLGPFERRDVALAEEVKWLEENRL
ncbi:MAG: hypothetical protein Q8K86_05965 [Candidatus Nanopelagicaceae bacterium]|nr:hypothetical protein [Candidatus Nanopelagicaceae bacterium]